MWVIYYTFPGLKVTVKKSPTQEPRNKTIPLHIGIVLYWAANLYS